MPMQGMGFISVQQSRNGGPLCHCLFGRLCLDTCRPEVKFMLRRSKVTVEIAIL